MESVGKVHVPQGVPGLVQHLSEGQRHELEVGEDAVAHLGRQGSQQVVLLGLGSVA